MAAYIIFKDGSERSWHLNERAPFAFEEIKDVAYVQLDGDELAYFVQRGIEFYSSVQTLNGVCANLAAYILWNETKDFGRPTITEEGINTLLQGKQHPEKN